MAARSICSTCVEAPFLGNAVKPSAVGLRLGRFPWFREGKPFYNLSQIVVTLYGDLRSNGMNFLNDRIFPHDYSPLWNSKNGQILKLVEITEASVTRGTYKAWTENPTHLLCQVPENFNSLLQNLIL